MDALMEFLNRLAGEPRHFSDDPKIQAVYEDFSRRNDVAIDDLGRALTDEECVELAETVAAEHGLAYRRSDEQGIVFEQKAN